MSKRHRERRRKRRLRQEQARELAQEPTREAATPWTEALHARALAVARNRYAAPVALAALTLAIYARSIDDPLIYWDDNLYVLDDARIQELSLANSWKILTEPFAANYHPLTTFTFAVDRAVWGKGLPNETWGFHLTQLAFYAGGVVLLYFVFRSILGSAPAAFAGAAIYATHTIHVESVAWLASRKDVVCLFFYAAAMLAYFRYAKEEKMRWGRYALFVALAAAAMFSKGYAAPLPFVLLAYDWVIARNVNWRRIVEKIPLVALAMTLFIVMAAAQEKDATPLGEIDTWHRLVQQCKIYAVYVARTILPVRLSINYCYAVRIDWLSGWVAALGACLGAGTVAAFFVLRRRLPGAAFGIAVVVMQLGTVMSVFFTLRQWMTDRYLFFPTIGSALALAAGGLWLYRNKSVPAAVRRYAVPLAAAAAVAIYSALTVARLGEWRSELDIWSDAVRKQLGLAGSGPLALREIDGKALSDVGSLQKVHDAYERAGRKETASEFMAVIARIADRTIGADPVKVAQRAIEEERYDDAIRGLKRMAEEGKFHAYKAWAWIGEAYRRKGEPARAREAYLKSVELFEKNPRSDQRTAVGAMRELGTLEFNARRYEAAAGWYRRARARSAPTDPRPVFFLALALERMGKLDEAYVLCREALALEGKAPVKTTLSFADVYLEMGTIAEKLGRTEEAAAHYKETLRRAPGHPQATGIRAKIKLLSRRRRASPKPPSR